MQNLNDVKVTIHKRIHLPLLLSLSEGSSTHQAATAVLVAKSDGRAHKSITEFVYGGQIM